MKPLLLALFTVIIASACHKNSNTAYVHGTITGYDLKKCACCGGYVLRLDNGDSSYRFFNFPAGSNVDSTQFPQSVYLNYVVTDSCGPYRFVKVLALTR